MPARFTGNAGSPAMISKQESPCIKFSVSKELRQRHLRNRTDASVVKPAAGGLRIEGKQQQSRQKPLPPRKPLQHPANISNVAMPA